MLDQARKDLCSQTQITLHDVAITVPKDLDLKLNTPPNTSHQFEVEIRIVLDARLQRYVLIF